MEIHYGGRITCLSNKIKREIDNLDSIQSMDRISGTNSFILLYIYKCNHPVFQRDIEKRFGITRSTASKVITLMEKKNLIVRKSVESDARLKQLVLSNEIIPSVIAMQNALDEFESRLTKGLNEEEKATLVSLIDRLENNLKEGNDL